MTKEGAILAIPGVTYRKWIFGRASLLGQSYTDNDNDEQVSVVKKSANVEDLVHKILVR